jgi:hypothetical protein
MFCVLGVSFISAATYYVDFADGDNFADGLDPERAWKHAPGDPNAIGHPGKVVLEPGDTVILKGGVTYHGSIILTVSGEAEKPITLDGNTEGTFGKGRAILDGARLIEGWQRVRSADDAGGNPRWEDIFFADIDRDIESNVTHDRFVVHRQTPQDLQAPWQRIILCDGEEGLLPIAQSPKPTDPFYPDLPGDFYVTSHRLDVREDGEVSVLTDDGNLPNEDPDYYDGMFIGVHGGNNHVYFARVRDYDPEKREMLLPHFAPSTYENTRYALYNDVKLIENPGEWSIETLGNGRSRVYLLPIQLDNGQPENIGFPVFDSGITVKPGASHLRIRGFLIQRFSGGAGGISVGGNGPRCRDVAIGDCEIRFVSGHAGIGLNYCDEMLVENAYIHHCPGWTTGVFLSRVEDYVVRDVFLDKNSGSGIRHYECRNGLLQSNVVLEHFGMHSSAINVYEGCADLVLEGNYVQNIATINRNARNIIFRNNVIDGLGRSGVTFGLWTSGRTGGRELIDVQFLNNTFVNTNHDLDWSAGILGQDTNSPGSPQGLVIRGNILDRIREDLPGEIAENIYTREVEEHFMCESCAVVTDLDSLFLDPANGDFRRRPGGPAMEAGANLPPPPLKPAGF